MKDVEFRLLAASFFGAFVGSTAQTDLGEVVGHVEQSVYGTERTATFQTK